MSDSATPGTAALQALLPTRFSRQEYWSGLSFPIQGIFPIQGLNPYLCISCIGRWDGLGEGFLVIFHQEKTEIINGLFLRTILFLGRVSLRG